MSSTWSADSELGERFPAWTRRNAADAFPARSVRSAGV